MSRRTFVAASTALLGLQSAHAAKPDDTLRFGLSGALDVIDPYFTGDREVTFIVGEMVFDTLLYRDPLTFQHQPLLATAWRWLDELTLEFDLREGVVWHDNVPFTAADVVYTFDYVANPANKISVPQWTRWIKSTEALSPHKVRVHLKTLFGPAPEYIAEVLPILPQDFYGPGGAAGGNGRLVGTGPYRITSFQSGKGASFEKNAKYFAGGPKGLPAIAKMAFRNIPDPATQIAELLGGGLDWIWRVSIDQLEPLAATPGIAVASGGTMRTFWVGFESRKGPFQDIRVRRAVAHAIDRQALTKNLMGGATQVLDVPCYPPQFGCARPDQLAHYDYNPDKARQLLAEAGYPGGFNTSMSFYRPAPDRMVAEAIQGYLRAVGIRSDLNATTLKAIYEDVAQGKVPIMLQSHGQYNINDVSIFLPLYYGGEPADPYRDPQILDWLHQASQTGDNDKRKALYLQTDQRIMDKAFGVRLFVQAVNYAFNKDLVFTPGPDEDPRLFLARWK